MLEREEIPKAKTTIQRVDRKPRRPERHRATQPGIPQQRVEAPEVRTRFVDAPALQVQVRFVPSLPVVRLRGELDLSNTHLLEDAVDSLVTSHCVGSMVLLDLHNLEFCDAAGLAAIDRARVRLLAEGKELALRDPPDILRRLLEITGLGEAFHRA